MIPKNLKIIKKLGSGSYANVFLVFDKNDKKYYALKNLKFKKNNNEYNDIINEIKIYMMFDHPNIIKIYDYYEGKNSIGILLEYASNGTLEDYLDYFIKNNRYLSRGKVEHIMLQLASGIKELHKKGIVHRDLKPANILIDKEYNIKIADFGVSKYLDKQSHAVTMIGTPLYMSPEIINGEKYNFSTDYWSLGCILYELIYLKRLFNANNYAALFYKIKTFNTKQIFSEFNIYNDLLEGLLHVNKEKRYDFYDIFKFLDRKNNDIFGNHLNNIRNRKMKQNISKPPNKPLPIRKKSSPYNKPIVKPTYNKPIVKPTYNKPIVKSSVKNVYKKYCDVKPKIILPSVQKQAVAQQIINKYNKNKLPQIKKRYNIITHQPLKYLG